MQCYLASLTTWLSVRLWTKWLWVRVQLQIKITCLPTSITSSSNIYIYSILMGKWKIPVQEILLPQFTSVTGNWRKSLKLIFKRTFKSNIVKLWSCKHFLTSSTTYLFIYIFICYLLLQFFKYPKQYVGSSTNFKNFSIQIIEAIRPNDNEGVKELLWHGEETGS